MSDQAPRSPDVFISYSSKNKEWADDVCAVLEKRGLRCWIAPRDILAGSEWGAAIIGGIAACKIMVLILSADANASSQVRREVERAISKGRTVLPFRIEDVLPEGALEYALGNTHWLNGFDPPRDRQLERLAEQVEAHLGLVGTPSSDTGNPAPSPKAIKAHLGLVGTPSSDTGNPAPSPKVVDTELVGGPRLKPRGPDKSRPPKVDDTLITNTLGMKLKLIPPGEFDMGSDASDPDASSDEKVNGKKHHVRITRPFYLGTTEVTVGQFRQFVEKKSYKTEAERDGTGGWGWNGARGGFYQDPKYTWGSPGFPQTDDHPVVNVSWNDAMEFCKWLAKQEHQVYYLPTEAEWEYSCRAEQASRYWFGDDPEGLAAVGNVADATAWEKYPDWTWAIKAKDGFVFTAPVGRFPPNAFGLFDMHGNVWEWCADWYASNYYAKSPSANPRNSTQAANRVYRGGSWRSSPRDCRSASRDRDPPGNRSLNLGFRVARVWSGQ